MSEIADFAQSLLPIAGDLVLAILATALADRSPVPAPAVFSRGGRTRVGLDLSAVLAPTDPAVVFSVLREREIESRSGTILEGEAGVNDPAGSRSCWAWSSSPHTPVRRFSSWSRTS